MKRPLLLLVGLLATVASLATLSAPLRPAPPTGPPRPKVADGWHIDLLAEAPDVLYPTALVCAPDGTIYLAQDPMDMPGPPTEPIDSIVTIRGRGAERKITVFADKLHAVMGLEWLDGALYVVHPPFLSRLRDTDGDGKADERLDLVTGLGPPVPAFNGINDHVATGLRLGMDGFLYVSLGDKGIPHAIGRDGKTIQLHGGGVIRVRPDGSDLEVVCTGLRNPLSTMLTAGDDVFTYGNDDDSKKWPNALAHCIDGGHYGYPYDFLTTPEKCLPLVAGEIGGSGTQGLCYEEDGLPAHFRGDLFVCEWGRQTVFRYVLEPQGASFRLQGERRPIVEAGPVGDFRPFGLVPTPQGDGLLLSDWGYNGWLAKGPKTGRLYELTYTGAAPVPQRAPRGRDSDPLAQQIAQLGHLARAERLRAQHACARQGTRAVEPLTLVLRGEGDVVTRQHALWALDAINTEPALEALRGALRDGDPALRREAVRALGIRRDRTAAREVAGLLTDSAAPVRREAAIALGRIGDAKTVPALLSALGEKDPVVAWCVRVALRRIGKWEAGPLVQALTSADPVRRRNALLAVSEVYDLAVVRALSHVATTAKDAALRREAVRTLGGLYRQYEPWDGNWCGTNPLAGTFPRKTHPWDRVGMDAIQRTLGETLTDADAGVRRAAIDALAAVGTEAARDLRAHLTQEPDPDNRQALVAALGRLADADAVPALAQVLLNAAEARGVRTATVDALAAIGDPAARRALHALIEDGQDEALIGQALVELVRTRDVSSETLRRFLKHSSASLRTSALAAWQARGGSEPELVQALLPLLDDPHVEVQRAAVAAAGGLKVRAAIPRLLELARQETLRPETLAALTQVPDPRGLDVYLAGLSDRNPDVRRGSEQALLAVRDLVAVELERRARQKQVPPVALPAVERVLTRFILLRSWRVLGPFARTNPPLFLNDDPIDFAAAHVGPNGIKIGWQTMPGAEHTGRVVLEPFKAGAGDRGGFGYDRSGSPDLNTYAYAEIESPAERDALLLVGSSGTVSVRVNGRAVLDYNNFAGRPYSPDADLVRIHLHKGMNHALVHTRQGIGTWCFSVQVSDSSQSLFAVSAGKVTLEDLRDFALKNEGLAERGKKLFFDPRGLGCVKCHAVEGVGGNIGPDLAGLAVKYDRAEVISSVLEPSKRIATGYQPVLVATGDGQVRTGLVRAETEQVLEVVDAEGKVTRIRKGDIEERRVSNVSIMPVGLVDALSREEFADLVGYLLSLRQVQPGPKK